MVELLAYVTIVALCMLLLGWFAYACLPLAPDAVLDLLAMIMDSWISRVERVMKGSS